MPVSKASANAITPAAKGDLTIGSGTNAASVLAVGTNNYVLTADSTQTTGVKWAAVSSGALTLISTTSFSAVTSQSFNNVFSSTYDFYKIILSFTDSNTSVITMKLRASGSDTSTGYYDAVRAVSSAGTATTDDSRSNSSFWVLGTNPSTTSSQRQNIFVDLSYPYSTSYTKTNSHLYALGNGNYGGYGWGVQTTSGTAFDGFTLFNSAGGANTITGTVSVYGWSK